MVNIKLLIHGRKNGYNVFFPKPTPSEFYSFASDIQSISANNRDVYHDKYFYTLAFVDEGFIFTKYTIGADVQRGQLGEIGISVFIPKTHKINGEDIISLLDNLINHYKDNYIEENKIIEPNNGFKWDEFTSIANRYLFKLIAAPYSYYHISAGTKEPAFHYYKSKDELIEHFNKPIQDEYSDYKQIYFIDINHKGEGKGNPLDVIKNSGDEVIPNIQDELLILNYFDTNKFSIYAFFNNQWNVRTKKEGENQIREKWDLKITYSKNENCYEQQIIKGTVSELSSYLEIVGNKISLKIDSFNPKPKIKRINFKIQDYKGKEVENAAIQIGKNNSFRQLDNTSTYEHDFKGDEIINSHSITVKKESENLLLESYNFIPLNEKDSLELRLNKIKKVSILVKNENGEHILSFDYSCNDGKSWREDNVDLNFYNDDIKKSFNIDVKYKVNGVNFEGKSDKFIPNDVQKLTVFCKKTENVINIKDSKFEISSGNVKRKNKILSFFSKHIKNIAIFTGIFFFLFAGFFIFKSNFSKDKQLPENANLNAEKIKNYLEGDLLIMSELETYRGQWKNQENDFIVKSGGGFFGGGDKEDSTRWEKEWKPLNESIDRAIAKRKTIDSRDFKKLITDATFRWSESQQLFITTIKELDSLGSLDPTIYDDVKKKLNDVSSLTLTEIKDSINSIFNVKENSPDPTISEPENITNYLKESNKFKLEDIKVFYNTSGLSDDLNKSLKLVKTFIEKEYKDCNTFKVNAKKDVFLKVNPNIENWVKDVCQDKQIPNTSNNSQSANNVAHTPSPNASANKDKTTEIINYLRGDKLKKATLEEYLKDANLNKNLKSSINLCLEFWELDGVNKGTYSSFQLKLKNDKNLKGSKLESFVNKMCDIEAVPIPPYGKADKEKGLKK